MRGKSTQMLLPPNVPHYWWKKKARHNSLENYSRDGSHFLRFDTDRSLLVWVLCKKNTDKPLLATWRYSLPRKIFFRHIHTAKRYRTDALTTSLISAKLTMLCSTWHFPFQALFSTNRWFLTKIDKTVIKWKSREKITSKEPKVKKQKTGQLLDTKRDMQESKLILLILALFLSVPLKKHVSKKAMITNLMIVSSTCHFFD